MLMQGVSLSPFNCSQYPPACANVATHIQGQSSSTALRDTPKAGLHSNQKTQGLFKDDLLVIILH